MSPVADTTWTPVSERFPHTCILASAGSGKTYQLTQRYLGLVAAGAPPGGILATTFTRLAAGEIKSRIFMRLADAADDEGKRALLASAFGQDDIGRDAVLDLLRRLKDEMHRMQVRTLDSFFGAIVSAFAIELGVPPDGRIIDDAMAPHLRSEAVRRMLAAGDGERLVALLRLLTPGASDRSVVRVIDGIVDSLYPLYRDSEPAAWSALPRGKELSPAVVSDAIARARAVPLAGKQMPKTRDGDMDRAQIADWSGFVKQGIGAKIAAGADTFGPTLIPPDLLAAYEPLVEHARAVLINRIRDQTIATYDLLDLYHTHYADVKRELRAMTFTDLTAAVLDAEKLGTFDAVCYRLDATIQHLLLDEFQDTNVLQWTALAPIATEIISDETRPRTFFCVGDVKQSIYGWRGACPEILAGIPTLLAPADGPGVIVPKRLHTSYRSAQVVIDAVNRVFESITANPALADRVEAALQFAEGFETHETARNDLRGAVELRVAPAAGDEKPEVVRLRAAAELVSRLYREAPDKKIGVLMRTNRAVARFRWELGPGRLDVPSSGRGGGPLTESPAVNAVLDLIRLADHPDDTVSGFNVARGPLGPVVDLTDERDAARRYEVARHVRRRLLDKGYAATIAEWTAAVADACDEAEYRRLLQLVEIAGEHDEVATSRPADFARWVELRIVPDVRAASVQVMTIHQSKGLEFPIVVLPELDWKLAGESPRPVVFERDGTVGPVVRVCRWMAKEIRALVPEVEPLFDLYYERTVRESLCLLYVAMTRAEEGLYMVIDAPKGKTPERIPATAAGVLRAAMADPGSAPAPGSVVFSEGSETYPGAPGASPPVRDAPADAPPARRLAVKLAQPRGTVPRTLTALRPSQRAAVDGTRGDVFRGGDANARDRGTAIHKLFEQVEWLDSFDPDEAALLALVRRTLPRRDDAWGREAVESFLAALARPSVRDTFTRPSGAGDVRVWRERSFARLVATDGADAADGPGLRLVQGVIDRLVLEIDPVAPSSARATVIDLKTDAVEASRAEERAEGYRGQLESYRDAVVEMFGLPESAVGMVLLFVEPGVAVALR